MPFHLHNLPGSGPRPGPREVIALLAGLMALNAFAIDAMIPALPDIGRSLNVVQENDRQLVVVSYFIGVASTDGRTIFTILLPMSSERALTETPR